MNSPEINKSNVGRIAERIVANELEYRGFRVSDLNKEGTSANADLLAAKDGKTWQIQVKGATWTKKDKSPWFNYGRCEDDHLTNVEMGVFNRKKSFYVADFVVLVSIRSLTEYCCVVLPVGIAEKVAQMNLNHTFRRKKKDDTPKKSGPMVSYLGYVMKTKDPAKKKALEAEQKILQSHEGTWSLLEESLNS